MIRPTLRALWPRGGTLDPRREALVDAALARLAADPADDAPLPDPEPIYWRAQVIGRLAERQEAAERAGRPLVLVQLLAGLAIAALAAVAASWLQPDLLDWIARAAGAAAALDGGLSNDPGRLALLLAAPLLLGAGLAGLQLLSEQR